MFARYDYNAGATAANIMADIVAILTGAATTSATLSASCNKPNTTITSTVAPGWAVHDAAAGSGAQVLKAAFADASGFKYAWLNFTATNYGLGLYETWNAGTHAGTNAALNSGASWTAGYSPSAGGTVFIFAAATYLHILCFTGSTYGIVEVLSERTRASLWDTSAVGVPPVGLIPSGWSSGSYYAPRTKSAAFADVTGAGATYSGITLFGGIAQGPPSSVKTPDTSGVPQYLTTDIYVASPTRGDMGGQLYGIKQVSTGGNTSDDVTVGGQTWFYLSTAQTGSSSCMCLPKF